MEKIKIGRVVNAVALRGEVKVYNYSGYKERYEELTRIIVDDKEYEIEKVRYQQHMVILKLSGINDRNAAESLKTKDVYISSSKYASRYSRKHFRKQRQYIDFHYGIIPSIRCTEITPSFRFTSLMNSLTAGIII